MPAPVSALRELLERRFPGAVPLAHLTIPVAATGVSELDRILPSGGLPRGRLSAWAPGGGATALLRAACRAAGARGDRAVWVDASGTTDGGLWKGTILVRPEGAEQALECAEELARCGDFGLVVLSAGRTESKTRVRLSRAVREGGGALVDLSADGFMAGLRVASRILPSDYCWHTSTLGEWMDVGAVTVRVRASALGWSKEAEIPLALTPRVHRLSLEPGLGDRRGAPC